MNENQKHLQFSKAYVKFNTKWKENAANVLLVPVTILKFSESRRLNYLSTKWAMCAKIKVSDLSHIRRHM